MLPTRDEVSAALQSTHLFRTLDGDQLEQVIAALEIGTLEPGQTLYREDDPAQHFYVLATGRVEVVGLRPQRKGKPERLAIMVAGDYFGEESLKRHGRRPVTITALETTVLLRLEREALMRLTRSLPALKPNLQIASATHRLLQHLRLSWLTPDEGVYIVARKHAYFLWEALAAPFLLGLASLAGMALFYFQVLPGTITPVLLTGLGYLISLGWGAWNIYDWSNDYSVVTSRRIVWLERVAGIYDSRQEAPLTTLLSVGVRSGQTGRWIGFGDVLVRTYTGTLILPKVAYPAQVGSLIEEYWTRSRTISRQAEAGRIEQTLRQRLNLPGADATAASPDAKTYYEVPAEVEPGLLQRLFANVFHMRFEQGGVVTYRKHWYVLFRMIRKPLFWIAAVAVLAWLRLAGIFTLFPQDLFLPVSAAAEFGLLLWFLYNYVDWRNDIYQVTPEQIVDLEKHPLGREERRAAPIENVLSIEYQRLGIMGLLLNFGTVTINIGAAKFTFDYVYNPSEVQQDIFRRMNERIEAKKRAEIEAERERISDWITIYHNSLNPKDIPGQAESSQ